MPTDQTYLRSLLQSHSARAFNCNEITKKLIEEGHSSPYLFRTPGLNFAILCKEVMPDEGAHRNRRHNFIGTKLMFPNDTYFAQEGERTVYLHDPNLLSRLRAMTGLDDDVEARRTLEHDRAILGLLDRLPNFDPFLVRDALESAGYKPHEGYFATPEFEQRNIREFIRRKFEPLVRRALGGEEVAPEKTMALVKKIWEARDERALAPLACAFAFPPGETLATFSAWKNINVYSFRYVQSKPLRETLALWLRSQARLRDFVLNGGAGYIDLLRRDTIAGLRYHWHMTEKIASEHDRLYSAMVRTPQGVTEFINFLRHSRGLSAQMALSLGKIDHAVAVWNEAMRTCPLGVLQADELRSLLGLLNEILAIETMSDLDEKPLAPLAEAV